MKQEEWQAYLNAFAERLKAKCDEAQLSQVDLAKALGAKLAAEGVKKTVSRQTVNSWFKAKNFPEVRHFMDLCEILDESADHLLFGKPRAPINQRIAQAKAALEGLTIEQRERLFRDLGVKESQAGGH